MNMSRQYTPMMTSPAPRKRYGAGSSRSRMSPATIAGMTGRYSAMGSAAEGATTIDSVMAASAQPASSSAFAVNAASPSANVFTMPCEAPYTMLITRMQAKMRPTGMVRTSSGSTEGSRRGSRLQATSTAADTMGSAAVNATAAASGSAYATKNSTNANVYDTYRCRPTRPVASALHSSPHMMSSSALPSDSDTVPARNQANPAAPEPSVSAMGSVTVPAAVRPPAARKLARCVRNGERRRASATTTR